MATSIDVVARNVPETASHKPNSALTSPHAADTTNGDDEDDDDDDETGGTTAA